MKIDHITRWLCMATLLPACSLSSAATEDAADWPCEQALVSEVAAAVVWDGPSIDGLEAQWRENPDVAAVVHRLAARTTNEAQATAAIAAFAEAQPAAVRDQRLSLLFAGVLQLLNQDRQVLNEGILRYARDQQRRADGLGERLSEFAQLESDTSTAAQTRLTALRGQIDIEQRIFDERESAIPFLCTRPRVIEQRIGQIAREIAAHLE